MRGQGVRRASEQGHVGGDVTVEPNGDVIVTNSNLLLRRGREGDFELYRGPSSKSKLQKIKKSKKMRALSAGARLDGLKQKKMHGVLDSDDDVSVSHSDSDSDAANNFVDAAFEFDREYDVGGDTSKVSDSDGEDVEGEHGEVKNKKERRREQTFLFARGVKQLQVFLPLVVSQMQTRSVGVARPGVNLNT